MPSRPAPATEFRLHNNERIRFPPLQPRFTEGELFFERFRALTPRGAKDSVIGEGGTGLIHLVRDELMDRIVALKLPHDLILRDVSARSDVIRETRQAIELTHPNIVRIHDFHEGEGGWGISMQYVRGKNLDEWRHEGQVASRHTITPYPVERIVDWIRQLLEALSYAHEDARMVHRDIKPKNLMLERYQDGREKLLLTDFGITQKLRLHTMMLSRAQPNTSEQSTMGTLPYMPWEQIQGGPPSVLDDVYAVGATIYELVTGRPPFYEGGYEQIRTQVETVVPPSMAERLEQFDLPNHGIPAAWEETVAACLAKRAEDRPASAREIAARLGLADGLQIADARDAEKRERLETEVGRLQQELAGAKARSRELEALLAIARAAPSGSPETVARLEETIAGLRRDLDTANAEALRWKESCEQFESGAEGEHEELVRSLQQAIAEKESLLSQEQQAGSELRSQLESLENDLARANAEALRWKESYEQFESGVEGEHEELVRGLQQAIAEKESLLTQEQQAGSELRNQLESLENDLAWANAEALRWKESYEQFESSVEGEHEELVRGLKQAISEKEALLSEEQQAAKERRNRIDALEKDLAEAGTRTNHLQNEIETLQRQAAEREQELSRQIEESAKRAREEMAEAVRQARKETDDATKQAEETAKHLRKLETERDKALGRLKQADRKLSAQLTPVLSVLIAALLLGATVGGVWGWISGGGETGTGPLPLDAWQASIPTSAETPGTLVTAGLVRTFLAESGVAAEDFDRVVAGLDGLRDDEPAVGVSWWLAEKFCGWLTFRVLDDGEITSGWHFTIAGKSGVERVRAEGDPPEWCADSPSPDDPPPGSRPVIGTRAGEEPWQIPSLGGTLAADGSRGISFRVVLRNPDR